MLELTAQVGDPDVVFREATSHAGHDPGLVHPACSHDICLCGVAGGGLGFFIERSHEYSQSFLPFETFRCARDPLSEVVADATGHHQSCELCTKHGHARVFKVAVAVEYALTQIRNDPRTIAADRGDRKPPSLRGVISLIHAAMLAAGKTSWKPDLGRTAKLSVVVPAVDEAAIIGATLRSARGADEIVVVDGGSRDRTVELARMAGARIIESSRGRGRQLRAGIEAATGDVILLLHADTLLPPEFRGEVLNLLVNEGAVWGRFDIRFDTGGKLLRAIARLISLRSRMTRVATGDQAIFALSSALRACGGVRDDVLFEDIDLCLRLRRVGRMGVPRGHATTSARRWREKGIWRTTFRMWVLKLLYLSGMSVDRLARHYPDVR